MAQDEKTPYFVSWSGGKDSCLAMGRMMAERGRPARLLTMFGEDGRRSGSHHLPISVLEAQSRALGVQLETRSASWDDYERVFSSALDQLRGEGIAEGVFGDIDLDEHREWVERVCAASGMAAREPLWHEQRSVLLREFVESGYVATVIAVKEALGLSDILGRVLDLALIDELEVAGIDPSGEEGEYHTVVTYGPGFSAPVELAETGRRTYQGYRFLEMEPRA